MSDTRQTIKKLTIKDSSGRLETFRDVYLVVKQFMGKDWYTIVLDNTDFICYNPDRIIFLEIKE